MICVSIYRNNDSHYSIIWPTYNRDCRSIPTPYSVPVAGYIRTLYPRPVEPPGHMGPRRPLALSNWEAMKKGGVKRTSDAGTLTPHHSPIGNTLNCASPLAQRRSFSSGIQGAFRGNTYDFEAIYSQTSLIRASLIRMPRNPNTLPSNLVYHFLFTVNL